MPTSGKLLSETIRIICTTIFETCKRAAARPTDANATFMCSHSRKAYATDRRSSQLAVDMSIATNGRIKGHVTMSRIAEVFAKCYKPSNEVIVIGRCARSATTFDGGRVPRPVADTSTFIFRRPMRFVL